eukprot:GHVU01020117.1.p1 GENE.GHVU01020117.1~~GHVU01020117.1.p1  ORF type:complete len:108 (-),score=25.87 GHVU01020117.1:257-580(-)
MSSPAITAALIAASQQQAADQVMAPLKARGAFGPKRAIALNVTDKAQRKQLDQLLASGVVRPVGTGRYYLDRDRQKEHQREAGWVIMVVVFAGLSILASVIAVAAAG